MNIRQNGRIASGAVIVAVGVKIEAARSPAWTIGPYEAELFWLESLRKLDRRSLRRSGWVAAGG